MNFVGARLVEGTAGPACGVLNPADGGLLNEFLGASWKTVDAAIEAASRSSAAWELTSADRRARILSDTANWLEVQSGQISVDLTTEQGKTYAESKSEVAESVEILRWFAGLSVKPRDRVVPSRLDGVRFTVAARAVGPVAVLTPWNSPLATAVRSTAAALSAGCTVVLKPSEEAPSACRWLAEAFMAAGLDNGVFNMLFGDPAAISRQLVADHRIRKISFTGPVSVARELAAAAGRALKPLTLELGGHAPVLIFEDADIAQIVPAAVRAKFENAGQICTAPTRFFVHKSLAQDFTDALRLAVGNLVVGEGWVDGVDMGPLANSRRLSAVRQLVDEALAEGARLICGGRDYNSKGNFYAPTLLGDVPQATRIMNDEPFGPVATINTFEQEDEVLANANALPYGLAGYAFTRDSRRKVRLQQKLEVGMIGVNSFDISLPETPFTGIKDSGYGYACGEEGLDNFSVKRLVAEAR